ncbi:hypothetical protein [Agrobacterium tumefaciens]|uniref:hypothetical protein n=1 Tax=Agrobacterium tumefaciens TaxID=358 RepID=UPI0021D3A656|nr:hypothetical protein [Agrobacterium tumefaciens]UXS05556.1 hypothetical protein FY156_28930 [Agrobacterium tumefaciens]
MGDNRTALAEVKPRLAALLDELIVMGADRLSIIYVMEKEVAALRDGPPQATPSRSVEEPSNDWPSS